MNRRIDSSIVAAATTTTVAATAVLAMVVVFKRHKIKLFYKRFNAKSVDY